MEPIEIPQEVADAEGVPDDLDSSVVGPYRFPNPRRRRLAAWIYLAGAGVAAWAGISLATGYWAVAAGLIALAVYHFVTAWDLAIEQEQALDEAARSVDFSVGHVSAAVAFEGWLAKPVWNVIVYSATEPPDRRALVRLDARTGDHLDEVYEEPLVS
jgi:hypothetical protein